ncbi:MAG: hypothetical protein C4324_11980 [Blastocatellia bacterium]
MLIHIVCWKYKPQIPDSIRREHIRQLNSLAAVIPEVLELQAGADIIGLERSFDTGLFARFSDREALDVYTNHPKHLEIAAMGKQIAERVVSVDFLSDEENG